MWWGDRMNSGGDDGRIVDSGWGEGAACCGMQAAVADDAARRAAPSPAQSNGAMHRHTRSMIFSPNKPCGLNSRNASATT